MNLWDILERLRQKQDHQKQHIAFAVSLIITLAITIVWLSTFSLDSNAIVANTVSPFQEFKQTFMTILGKEEK